MSRPDITQSEQALYFDTPPAITILKEKKVRAKFIHGCHCCCAPIMKGELHWYFFVKDEESIPPRAFASRQHLHCPGGYEP